MGRRRTLCKSGASLAALVVIGCAQRPAAAPAVPVVATIVAERSDVVVGDELPARTQPVPIATSAVPGPIVVELTFPASRANFEGQVPVRTSRTSDGTTDPLDGTLDLREVIIDPATQRVTVRAVFPNPEGWQGPEMDVWVFVPRGIEHGIAVPWRAVRRDSRGTQHALLVDAEGRVAERALEIVGAEGERWLVRAGLASGDEVIVDGVETVRPGDVVRAVRVAPESARRI